MIVKKADLVAVTDRKSGYPGTELKEIAFAGRSNVGKSSLINLLLNRKIARTSGSPGKTRTINFYEINGSFRIVDLPGYGYAKVSRSISQTWGAMVEGYLSDRPNLVRVVQLVDIRHAPTAQDKEMYEWSRHYGFDGIVVATKSDKLSKSEINKNLAMIRKELCLTESDRIFPVSALKKTGMVELETEILQLLEV